MTADLADLAMIGTITTFLLRTCRIYQVRVSTQAIMRTLLTTLVIPTTNLLMVKMPSSLDQKVLLLRQKRNHEQSGAEFSEPDQDAALALLRVILATA
jgi:hypothetical protein